jgi:hypothetical protein
VCRGQGYRIWAPEGNLGDERRAYRHHLLPRQLPTRLRYGNSARQFDKIRTYAVLRLAILVGKRYQRGRRYGWVHVTQLSPNCLGLISLNGRVIAPRANRPWRREGPNALGEGRR